MTELMDALEQVTAGALEEIRVCCIEGYVYREMGKDGCGE